MFMYILSVEGYGQRRPTRPCTHDFIEYFSSGLCSEGSPGAARGPESQEFQKNQSLQNAAILRCKLLCKNCILMPGAARGPRATRHPKNIRASKKEATLDVSYYVRIAFWGLGQPGPRGPRIQKNQTLQKQAILICKL